MNQSFAGLFSIVLLLSILFIGGGVIASQLYQAHDQINGLQNELTTTKDAVDKYNETITKKDVEIQNLKAQLDEIQQRRQQTEDKAADLAQKLTTSQAERDRLVQQDRQLIDRITALTTQVQELQNKLNSANPSEIVAGTATTPIHDLTAPIQTLITNPAGTLATWFVIFSSGFLVSVLALSFRLSAMPAPATRPAARPSEIPDPLDLSQIYPTPRKDNHPAPRPLTKAGVHPNDHPTAPLKLTRITDPTKSRAQHTKDNR
jgi:hypothetical protein